APNGRQISGAPCDGRATYAGEARVRLASRVQHRLASEKTLPTAVPERLHPLVLLAVDHTFRCRRWHRSHTTGKQRAGQRKGGWMGRLCGPSGCRRINDRKDYPWRGPERQHARIRRIRRVFEEIRLL